MKLAITLLLFLSTSFLLMGKENDMFSEFEITLSTQTGDIFGTMTIPEKSGKIPVALIIAGSGPTDRDGNNPIAGKNNSLQMLAHELAKNGIASIRFDKRGIGESVAAMKEESELLFNDYISDVEEWISMLKKDERFSSITIIGHSEGSLIGMAASSHTDKFISLAGAGESADKTLKRQLGTQPKEIQDLTFPIIDKLKEGNSVEDVNPMLYSLFRPSIQPYLISWFNHDPQEIIGTLSIPTLIIQGTNDLQVTVEDAQILAKAQPKATLTLIENMNHVLKIVDEDPQQNAASYNIPDLPISDELIKSIVEHIYNN